MKALSKAGKLCHFSFQNNFVQIIHSDEKNTLPNYYIQAKKLTNFSNCSSFDFSLALRFLPSSM